MKLAIGTIVGSALGLGIVGPAGALVGGSIGFIAGLMVAASTYRIGYVLVIADAQTVQGGPMEADFETRGELKKAMARLFKDFQCPWCGSKNVSGSGVVVSYGKAHLYRQEEYKGWLGGTKHKDVFVKTVWRVHQVGLRNAPGRALLNFFGTLDDPPGKLKCNAKGCSWTESGERGGTISVGEFLKRPFG